MKVSKYFFPFFLTLYFNLQSFSDNEIIFRHLSVDQGLSNSVVYCMVQDSKGFMWLGTEDGLNKYDGYKFTIYKHDPANVNSISNNVVMTLFLSDDGLLWIGSVDGGLNCFDPETEKFKHYKHDPDNPESISDIQCIPYQDSFGTFWVGTSGDGLNRFDPVKEIFIHYRHDPNNQKSISSNYLTGIIRDKSGYLWIGTVKDGLNKFDFEKETFTHYKHDPDNPFSISDNKIIPIIQYNDSSLLIGTRDGELNLFDIRTEKFKHFKYATNDGLGISQNYALNILKDKSGTIWTGTYGGGLNCIKSNNMTGFKEDMIFNHFNHDPTKLSSISNDYILSIYQDHSGMIWTGTAGGGLNQFDPRGEKFMHMKHDPFDINTLSHNFVMSIFEDHTGNIWIGTNGGGLNRFDIKDKTFKHYKHDPLNPNSISCDDVRSIVQDSSGYLWIGTFGGGLNGFDPEIEKFTKCIIDLKEKSVSNLNYLSVILQDDNSFLWFAMKNGLVNFNQRNGNFSHYLFDSPNHDSILIYKISSLLKSSTVTSEINNGAIWVGTDEQGLCHFDLITKKTTWFRHEPGNPSSISSNNVLSIIKDQNGSIWIGTLGGGLNKMLTGVNINHTKFIHWKENDKMPEGKPGPPDDVIYGIVEDGRKNLWLSTNKGISKFTPPEIAGNKKGIFKNYDVTDGLQGNEFNRGAFLKTRDGKIYFGGVNGINIFHPDSINDNTELAKMVITGFQIFNKPVSVISSQLLAEKNETYQNNKNNKILKLNGEYYLPYSINHIKELILSYKESVFSFEYAALHYSNPLKNQYAYKLDGFDNNWNYVGSRRFATYTNLKPGAYTFMVKGNNSDGVWTDDQKNIAQLRIIITPPFWQTWWFYLICITLFILSLIFFIRLRERRLQKEKRFLLENQKLSEKINKHQKELIKTVVSTQENERKRIAGELHDGIGSTLATIKHVLTAATDSYNKNEKDKFYKTSTDLLDQACTDLRNLSHEMMPGSLLKLGLIAAIKEFLENISKSTNLKINFNTHGIDKKLEEPIAIALFRIIQEAVNNICKHAAAKEVNIEIVKHKDTLNVMIEDDGKGFITDKPDGKTGIGLKNMESRVNYINGKFVIDSKPGHGTNLIIEIPL